MRVTLDANVLVYSLHVEDRRHARAVEIVGRATAGDCVLTMQALAETFNVLTRKRGFEPRRASEEINRFRRAISYCAVQPADLDAAMDAVADHQLAFWDAMMWATARRTGCGLLLSEDFQDGRELDGVRFVDPFKPENRTIVDLALPPRA